MTAKHLRIVACGAEPASDLGHLVALAQSAGWSTAVAATPSSLAFVNVVAVEMATGFPVRHTFVSTPVTGRMTPKADALIVAPATFNSMNKIATGIAENYALTAVAEMIGRGVPTVIVPFVNAALANRRPFQSSVASVRAEGVRVIFGSDDGWEPHEPGGAEASRRSFPWEAAARAALDNHRLG